MGGAVVGAGDESLGGGRDGGRDGGCVDAPGASGVQHQENEVTVCRLLRAPGSRIMTCPDSWLPGSQQQLGDKPRQQPHQRPHQRPPPAAPPTATSTIKSEAQLWTGA